MIAAEGGRRIPFHLRFSIAVVTLAAISCAPQTARRTLELEEIGVVDTPGWAHDVALDASTIWVSDRQGGVRAFSREGLRPLHSFTPVSDVISLDPRASGPVLAARFDGVVSLSPQGQLRARLPLDGDIANVVRTRGDLAFVAFGLHGLVVARIDEAGRIVRLADLPTRGWSHDVQLAGHYALLADWDYGLRVIDIRDPLKPVEAAVVPTPATVIAVALGTALDGRRLAAVAEGHGGVSVVDVSNADRPRLLAREPLELSASDRPHPEHGGWPHDVAWCGSYVVVANWKRGIAVLDASDPSRPRLVAEHPTPGTALGIAAEPAADGSHTLFLADGEAGLRLLRLRLP